MKPKLLANSFEIKFFSTLGVILFVIVFVSFLISGQLPKKIISSKEISSNPFASLNLTAKSVYVYDVRTNKVLFSKNPDERLPLASLTKLMTALVAKSSEKSDDTVTITNLAIKAEGDSGLRVGEKWSLQNLLDFLLTSSSNDGATAVALAYGAEQNFINAMNSKADEIGMLNTYYLNPTGVDLPAQAGVSPAKGGAYGSAKDTAKMLAFILKNYPDLLTATTKAEFNVSSLNKIVHVAKNTDSITESIPGLKGSKTGFTNLAGGNLVIAFDPELGRPIIISVLGSTAEARFTDMEQLINASFQSIQNQQN